MRKLGMELFQIYKGKSINRLERLVLQLAWLAEIMLKCLGKLNLEFYFCSRTYIPYYNHN